MRPVPLVLTALECRAHLLSHGKKPGGAPLSGGEDTEKDQQQRLSEGLALWRAGPRQAETLLVWEDGSFE